MLYANVSITRADMRAHDPDTFALAYVSARPAVFVLSAASQEDMTARAAKPAPAQARPASQRHFDEYLQLHRSRAEAR